MIKPKTSRREKRNGEILKDFRAMYNKGYRVEVIFKRLSDRYFIAPETAQKITYAEAKKFNTDSRPP
ncbi:hypothetical protein ABIB40_000032 [Pedobacter sp. UYP30]